MARPPTLPSFLTMILCTVFSVKSLLLFCYENQQFQAADEKPPNPHLNFTQVMLKRADVYTACKQFGPPGCTVPTWNPTRPLPPTTCCTCPSTVVACQVGQLLRPGADAWVGADNKMWTVCRDSSTHRLIHANPPAHHKAIPIATHLHAPSGTDGWPAEIKP
jgi:hypothetical protein